MTLSIDEAAFLTEMMENCAQAMYDDRYVNFSGTSANPWGVAAALDEVAGLFGVESPTGIYERLCEET